MLVSDDQGGAICMWNDNRSSVFDDIYAQHLDALGNRLWNPEGVPVIVEAAEQYVQDVLADGQGGAFFSYTTGSGYSPRVGRLNSSGQLLWTAQPGPGGSGYGGIDLVPDDAGGFYAIWSSVPAWQIYAQRYNAEGQPLWLAGGLPVSHSPGSDDYAEAVSDNAGGFIVVWRNYLGSDFEDIYAQHVTSGAELLWGLSDLIVCSQGDWQLYPCALPDGSGGVAASWADYRNAAAPNLYGQRVLSNGILGNFPELELTVTPLDTPIVLPPAGGSFHFRVNLQNNFGAPLRFDFWTNVLLPNGSNYGPLLLRNDATISTGGSLSRTLTQTVPAGAPAGQYLYRVWVGDHPVAPWDGGSFTFTKLGSGSGGDWAAQGWELPELPAVDHGLPVRFELFPAYPNPFNATTSIRFALPEASWVRLEVFDVSGREVGAHGWSAAPFGGAFVSGSGATPTMYAAGTHEISFDGSRLASGIYLYRLQAGGLTKVQKMILVK